jgi:membrane-associated phospholipid phosphatase
MFKNKEINPLAAARYFIYLFAIWIVVGFVFLTTEQNRGIYLAINEQHTAFKDAIFPYLTNIGEAWVIIPCLLLLFAFKRFRTGKFALAMVACNISPFLITQAIKAFINAPRPLNYFQMAPWIHRVAGQPVNLNYSFPSGHSEGSFAFLCFLSLLLPKRYRILGVFFFFVGLTVLYSRMYLSQHFYRDVYVGSVIGGLCSLFFFWLINPLKTREIQ